MARQSGFALISFVSAVLIFSVEQLGVANSQAQTPSGNAKANQKAASDDLDRLRPKVKLGKVPAIELAPRDKITEDKATQIKTCIAQLADIDEPDYGLSATMSGQAFLPLPSQTQSYSMILTDHQLKSSDALKTLVEIGPDALPFLLDALDDKSPTKLKIEHRSGFGGMWLANGLWGNPVNEQEMKILGAPQGLDDSFNNEKTIQAFTVKVGDVCLVAIGQIVGRGYQAVRYQPTASIVINSPTEDGELCEQVRKIWTSDDPTQKLLDALLLDYATEGVFQVPSLDSWALGNELQIQAAMRLLYYYPKETASLVAERLRNFDVNKASDHGNGSPAAEQELDAYIRREVANGVRTDDFIKAVSWCREPKIHEAIRDIFTKTDDIDLLLAALPSIEDTDRNLIIGRLTNLLDTVPPVERGAYGDGYNLLAAFAERLGKDAAPAFERYLEGGSAQRGHSASQALKESKGDWCVAILSRLLDDSRPTEGYSYAVHGYDQNTRLPIRACDAATEALEIHRPELSFSLAGEYKELDEQIEAIRDKVAGKQR